MPQEPAIHDKKQFDVFLCHNSKDKPEVKRIAQQLKAQGIVPWLDEWELPPGLPWQPLLEQEIGTIKSAAVFVGKEGTGPWQDMELYAFLRQFVQRKCPVIPVVLEDAPEKPHLPLFLEGMTWVDFRKQEPDPIKQLIWGITSKKPGTDDIKDTYIQSHSAQSPSTLKAVSLPLPKRFELVDKLLACSCLSNRESRETVLSLLNEEYSGIVNGIQRRADNRADVMEIVSVCLKHRGSLPALINLACYFEGETSVNAQQLRAFTQANPL